MAQKSGSPRQILEALYQDAWTHVWWFDDLEAASEKYDSVKEAAFYCGRSHDLEKLGNLYQIFIAPCRAEPKNRSKFHLGQRSKELCEKLVELSADHENPNNALYAEALIALHGFSNFMLLKDGTSLKKVWVDLIDIIDRAKGHVEFPAKLIDTVVQGVSGFVPDSTEFDDLMISLGSFMSAREKQGKEGEIYHKQGLRKFKAGKPSEAIIWLVKAGICYHKKEFQEQQIETLYLLALAYKSIGLLWMARSTILGALVVVIALGDQDGEMREEAVPIVKLYTLICLQLGCLPNVLQAVYLLRIFQSNMTLSEVAEERLNSDLQELDELLACLLIGCERKELEFLEDVPSQLESLGLSFSYFSLIYKLGYSDELKS